MPLKRDHDSNGPYYQWGNQKKYYYKSGSAISRKRAKQRAINQMIAIKMNGYIG
jgi:hypothetical protein